MAARAQEHVEPGCRGTVWVLPNAPSCPDCGGAMVFYVVRSDDWLDDLPPPKDGDGTFAMSVLEITHEEGCTGERFREFGESPDEPNTWVPQRFVGALRAPRDVAEMVDRASARRRGEY